MTTMQRLFDATHAFDHPVTIVITIAVATVLVFASAALRLFATTGKLSDKTYTELRDRIRSWYVLSAAGVVPILLGAAWTWAAFLLLGLFCFREFAKATGLDRSRVESATAIAALFVTYFAALDHWLVFFETSWALGICAIAVFALLPDQPQGYIRRTTLAIVAFALCGGSLGHLAFIANDENYRPILLWLLVFVELNDVFAYLFGKTFGKRKLRPNTSPGKTWAGALGAVVATTAGAAVVGHFVFEGTSLDRPLHLLAMGLLISVLGQCGDLIVSSIKRDLGVKDMSDAIPGHGGLLDRFDSLLIAAPALFHYMNYFLTDGIGAGQAERILTGG
jgi:phosphatidate cytidylyltransferase